MLTRVTNLRDYAEYYIRGNRLMRCKRCTVDITSGLFFRKTESISIFKNWADTWRYVQDGKEVQPVICEQLRDLINEDYARKVLDEAMQSA